MWGCAAMLILAAILCTMLFGPIPVMVLLGLGVAYAALGVAYAALMLIATGVGGALGRVRLVWPAKASGLERQARTQREPIFTEPAGTVIKVALLGALALWALVWFLR